MALPIVFVAGSRHISRLPIEVEKRLDTMIEKRFQILVGDANGADKAVQRHLADEKRLSVPPGGWLAVEIDPGIVSFVAEALRVQTFRCSHPQSLCALPDYVALWA
jgi:hypothetical protein